MYCTVSSLKRTRKGHIMAKLISEAPQMKSEKYPRLDNSQTISLLYVTIVILQLLLYLY